MSSDEKDVHIPATLPELFTALQRNGIPRKEYKKYMDRFLDSQARKNAIPLSGMFELTPFCNLDCKMCYVHLKQQVGQPLLSTEDWKDIMFQAHHAGMLKACLTGGECLTYPGFNELYLALKDMGVEITVFSNGLLLNEERIDFFCKHRPRLLSISLYGSSDEAYEKVTGKRAFHTIYHNIVMAKEAGLPIVLSITPNSYMYSDMESLLEKAHATGLNYNINSQLFTPRDSTGNQRVDLSNEQYMELYKFSYALVGKSLTPREDAMINIPEHAPEQKGFRCAAGQSAFAVTWEGKLCPCVNFPELNESVLTQKFADAWIKVNKMAKEYPIPAECEICDYRKLCLKCPAMHKHSEHVGHCDVHICERTRMLIENGFDGKNL